MKHPVYIYDELKEIAPYLAEVEKKNIFSVPAGYFSRLDVQILEIVKSDFTNLLPASHSSVLTVPDGYFDNLAGNILQKIKNAEGDDTAAEVQHLFPQLYAQKNKNAFSVPEGYFEAFNESILGVVKSPAKVVAMKKRSMLWNCATAAMLTGVMAVSALWVTDKPSPQNPGIAVKNSTSNNSGYSNYKNEQQINNGIADLSDMDIIGYLETTGGAIEDDVLASVIGEKDLPAEQDYLTDENTLEIFFDSIDSPNKQN